MAALVLAIIALLVAGGVSERVEELTEKIEELEEKIEGLESKDEDEAPGPHRLRTRGAGCASHEPRTTLLALLKFGRESDATSMASLVDLLFQSQLAVEHLFREAV